MLQEGAYQGVSHIVEDDFTYKLEPTLLLVSHSVVQISPIHDHNSR